MDSPSTTPSGSNVPSARPVLRRRTGVVYEPAIGPRLKVLLAFVFFFVGVLGGTGLYLLVINKALGQSYVNQFTLWMFIAHVVLGVMFIFPFIWFGVVHWVSASARPNRLAVRLGIILFSMGLVVSASGVALIQLEGMPQLPTEGSWRSLVYYLHVLAPIAAVALYVAHRRAGPAIKWSWGAAWGVGVALFIGAMTVMHSQDPRAWYAKGPEEGERYFEPSKTRTTTGNFIPAESLMMNDYCLKCHQDVYNDWFHSSHHFSSFNNPPYLHSVRETRKVSLERDGNVRASRWCAGCHDPVPLFSGAFSDPKFDDVSHPTAHAGITCTVCHAMTHVNSSVGNGDYTIEEPIHYPFAYSQNGFLQWLNNQVVKAKPDFHKRTFLKPFHRSAEFCSTCHKVSIPLPVTHYREFQRGQDHYTTYLLSGVSGVGARSFYYPPEAKTRCADCHMPLTPSNDFGSRDFDGSGIRKVHGHFFPGANTGLASLLLNDPKQAAHREGFEKAIAVHRDFLRGTDATGKDKKLRLDIFGVKESGIEGKLQVVRPTLPVLEPGKAYIVEIVLRTLIVGHPFPQGTADSNEIWVEVVAESGGQIVGQSGRLSQADDSGRVDEWSHFVNVLMLDRHGNRINRRNPQDIFTPLYDHQIPPGAAQVAHYELKVPARLSKPITLTARLRYRKFDHEYMSIVFREQGKVPTLPIVDICEDAVTLPVRGVAEQPPAQASPIQPAWQRWNDYGIGCFLEGGAGSKKGEFRQAEECFRYLTTLPEKDAHPHGFLNLARVYFDEGRLSEAVEVLTKASKCDPPAPWWTVAWFTALVDAQNGHLEQAAEKLRQILDVANAPADRKFDFSRDFVVINELAATLFRLSQQESDDRQARDRLLVESAGWYEKTLSIEAEDLDAHYGLAQCYARLSEGSQMPGAQAGLEVSSSALQAQATILADASKSEAARLQAASNLCELIPRLAAVATEPDRPKLPVWLGLIKTCRQALPASFAVPPEPSQAAIIRAISLLYRETHGLIRPDDNAKDRAIRLYREKHPAAAAASQAIVVYPLHAPQAVTSHNPKSNRETQ